MENHTADAWGIEPSYWDALGRQHHVGEEARQALTRAMGPNDAEANIRVVRRGGDLSLSEPGELELETGERMKAERSLPLDLPFGYHELTSDSGQRTLIISAPDSCVLPQRRMWGWGLQLYALRSSRSWGMGDFGDLREFARWSADDLGAAVILVNPVQANTPGLPQQASPYFPSSRLFRNLLYLRIEDIAGANDLRNVEALAAAGRDLNRNRMIRRDEVYSLKMQALEALWEKFDAGDPAFARYCREHGKSLDDFAVFNVLSEVHGRPWQLWPDDVRNPCASGVQRVRAESANRIGFHKWIQWQLDRQFAAAAERLAIIQDLPIGVDPDGFDAWVWQDTLAQGISVGAPPDAFNTQGQDWGVPPFIPRKLRAAGYRPFIQTLRASLAHAGGLRIDHVMGLFRLFWIPVGLGAQNGTYVRYKSDELLAIVAIESHRAKAFIVGEDLGTVEPGVREELAARNVLSYRLLWFEQLPVTGFPEKSLAAVTTHDLPTIAGIWTGADLAHQQKMGSRPNLEMANEARRQLKAATGMEDHAPVDEVIVRTYSALSAAPSLIITATVEDAIAAEERPNVPAVMSTEWPNWSMALPLTVEEIQTNKLARNVAQAVVNDGSAGTR